MMTRAESYARALAIIEAASTLPAGQTAPWIEANWRRFLQKSRHEIVLAGQDPDSPVEVKQK
jgi:hypothetical protein